MERYGIKGDLFTRRDFLKISSFATGGVVFSSWKVSPGFAKEVFPANRITFIVPHQAGGGHDTFARTISPFITKYLRELSPGAKGGEIMIKNEPAGAGRKGRTQLFNSKPDGYTLGIMDTAPITDSIVTGDTEFDFTKLTFLLLGTTITKLIAAPKNGYNSWNEVMTAHKKETIKLGVAQFGRGNHVSAIIMNEKLGTRFKVIPFTGSAESMNALLRGDVPLCVVAEDAVTGLIKAKELKILLSFTEVSEYPGAVTIKDLGHPELVDQINNHRFIVAPPGLPDETKRLLLEAIKRATADREFLALAKNANFNLKNVYGNDAERLFLQFIKFYGEIAPVLKKNLT